MTYPKYNFILYLLAPLIGLYFLYRGFKDKRYWFGFSQRLGLVNKPSANPSIHLHCASVGESIAAIPLILQLKADFPNFNLLITTTSPTGKQEILNIIRKYSLEQTTHCYLPIDWLGSVRRFIQRIDPKISILMETEIWPNLTRQLKLKDIPVVLANARLSEKSLNQYLKRETFAKQLFSNISLVAAQYPSDAANFSRLGIEPQSLSIVGSTKFDIQISEATKLAQQEFADFAIQGRPSWIAASIHPGEFESILLCHRGLLKIYPDLLLVAVPRHPEAFPKLKKMCEEFELNFVSKSEKQPVSAETQVIVGDTMGEMTIMCGAVELAFIGGSLIPRGGHNPLEAAVCGIPVAIGPSSYNFSDVCQIMRSSGTLESIENQQQLEQFVINTLANRALLKDRKRLTAALFENNRGSAIKISGAIKQLLITDC